MGTQYAAERLPTPPRWGLALRGIAAILFGILVWAWLAIALHVLVILFGIFAILAGIRAPTSRSWWFLLIEGFLAVLAGIIALVWPTSPSWRCSL